MSGLCVVALEAAEFCTRVGPFLATREAENNLPWGIARRLASKPAVEQRALFLSIENADEVVGALVWTPPYEIVVTRLPSDSVALVAARCLESGWPIEGTMGPSSSGRELAGHIANVSGRKAAVRVRHLVYELVTLNPVPRANGKMRPATDGEVELVADWYAEFARETAQPVHHDIHMWARASIASGSTFLWVADGGVQSLACLSRETPNGRSIGPVYTPVAARRRGYATSLVADLSRRVLKSGKRFAMLFTDAANPTTNHIYESIGFRRVCDYDAYTLVTAT